MSPVVLDKFAREYSAKRRAASIELAALLTVNIELCQIRPGLSCMLTQLDASDAQAEHAEKNSPGDGDGRKI